MATTHTIERVYELLAQTIEYPTPVLRDQAQECAAALEAHHPHAARAMKPFVAFTETAPLAAQEELYTATFDMRPVCFPYLGFQLFGESYKRGEFLVALSARCREAGFDAGSELPDHLGAVLRYLAHTSDEDLVTEGLVPALQRMIDQLEGNPYRAAMQAILAVFRA